MPAQWRHRRASAASGVAPTNWTPDARTSSIDMVLAGHSAKYLPFSRCGRAGRRHRQGHPGAGDCRRARRGRPCCARSGRRARATSPCARVREHVQIVVRNEFADLLTPAARLRHLEATLRETERRCDALIASSRDPIAYVHEGMHIRANDAYLEMFGFEGFDDIEGLSLLDLIAPQHVDDFKQLLKKLQQGRSRRRRARARARSASTAASFAAVMEFTAATYEGESCLQIVFRQQTVDAELARKLDDLRQRDPVTGLFNRQHFMTELEAAVAAAADGKGHAGAAADRARPLRTPARRDRPGCGRRPAGSASRQRLQADARRRDGHRPLRRPHLRRAVPRARPQRTPATQAERIRAAFARPRARRRRALARRRPSASAACRSARRSPACRQVLAKSNQCLQSAVGVGGNRIEIFDPGAARPRRGRTHPGLGAAHPRGPGSEGVRAATTSRSSACTGDRGENLRSARCA